MPDAETVKMSVMKFCVEFITVAIIIVIIFATGDPIAIGVGFAALIFFAANTSGGHLNPAVTVSMYAAGKVSLTQSAYYIIAQLLGALTGYWFYKTFIQGTVAPMECILKLNKAVS